MTVELKTRYPVAQSPLTDITWRKSSYSGGGSGGGNCVEVGASAAISAPVRIRDSKAVNGPALAVSPVGWNAFVSAVQAGAL
ncbi:DUF397 domain-containing protein [Streptomyces daliensis]|uniref:DUF397 domain-containing protein n=1 Tax=Streptomyces daliensis TaxID=299421 RepID=A0A8T4IZQ9_9ACTN|nr:DUF397 domain-containing protein [Streptomyces daliensis]